MIPAVIFKELPAHNGKIIGSAQLNSEKTLNSLTLEMCDLLLDQFQQWQKNEQITAIFIHSAGEKAFCAGGDIQALYRSSIDQPGGPCEYAESFFKQEYQLDFLLHNYNKPIVVWGHGIVMGGGLGIHAACKHRIVTEKTRIAMPEVTIALFPDVGGSYFLNRMPGQCGRFLALTAASINAADSLYSGLADYFVNHHQKNSVLNGLQTLPLSGNKTGDDQIIASYLRGQQQNCIAEMPSGNLEPHQTIIDDLCAGDNIEDISDRFTAFETDNKWLQRAKQGLSSGSPLAIKWIFKQLSLSKNSPLKTVFEREILLATNIVRHTEFAEGVRALIIDKDQNPQWQYKKLSDVCEKTIAPFFEAPWPKNPLSDLLK